MPNDKPEKNSKHDRHDTVRAKTLWNEVAHALSENPFKSATEAEVTTEDGVVYEKHLDPSGNIKLDKKINDLLVQEDIYDNKGHAQSTNIWNYDSNGNYTSRLTYEQGILAAKVIVHKDIDEIRFSYNNGELYSKRTTKANGEEIYLEYNKSGKIVSQYTTDDKGVTTYLNFDKNKTSKRVFKPRSDQE